MAEAGCLACVAMTRRDGGHNFQAARATSDGGDFCATKFGVRRSIQWWWRCFDWRLGAKNLMKVVSLWRWIQPLMATGKLKF